MSTRLVDATSAFLARRLSRRGFLVRAAVAGSALATDPVGFVLRPGTAYASVCGPDSTCGAGYTVFCCTVNNGSNSCPPGTIAAGWWKADGAALCGGAARYYLDCNATCSRCSSGCGSFCSSSCWSCSCRCGPTSSCDQRRVCCNVFRYGQCHQEVSCVGPVACRMVTCTPPYRLGMACSTASATDNATVAHSAPCQLNRWDAIAARYYALGGSASVLGTTIGGEYAVYGGVGANFARGRMYASSATGAHYLMGSILTKYLALHGTIGVLGFPTSDDLAAAGGGRFSLFSGGLIVAGASTGAHYVRGAIAAKYLEQRGTAGVLGYPTTDEAPAAGGGYYNLFTGGVVVWSAATGAHYVRGAIASRYLALRGTAGPMGHPRTDELPAAGGGTYNLFTGGLIVASASTGAHEVRGAIAEKYLALHGTAGRLGYPVTGEYAVPTGVQSEFQGGWIARSTATGRVTVRYK